MRVKICGVTRPEDAALAAKAGADFVGVVFYPPSPRYLSPARAGEVAAAARERGATPVAVLVDPGPDLIREVLAELPGALLQFHGAERPADCAAAGRRYWKAIRMTPDLDVAAAARSYPDAQAILLDTYRRDRVGGTGRCFDWELVPGMDRPLVLSGGLNPDNVALAVARLAPWAVDVSTGVEASPGIKDPAKLARFIDEAKG